MAKKIADGTFNENFPSFSEGLSLRVFLELLEPTARAEFPFLFGGTFIEGRHSTSSFLFSTTFPFLFGGTFIEGTAGVGCVTALPIYFPSFSEGLSLRGTDQSRLQTDQSHFPSFSEGLSLRVVRFG